MYHALTPTIFFISSNSVGLLFNHSPTKPVNCSPSFLVNCDQNKTTLTTYPWPATKQPAMKRKANTILLACFTLNSWDTSQMVGSHYSYMLWSFSMIWNNFCCCSVAKSYLTLHDPKTAACQASLSLITSWSLPKFMFIASVMPSKHLILCRPLLLLPSIFPSLRVFSNELAEITIGLFPTSPLSLNPQYFIAHQWWSFLTLFIFQVQTDQHVCIHTHSLHLCSSYQAWRICSLLLSARSSAVLFTQRFVLLQDSTLSSTPFILYSFLKLQHCHVQK